jgi:nucleoside-diphosphate-sugar epimerase
MKTIKIAILGATSHIAKGLIYYFNKHKGYHLCLFSRSPQKIRDFLKENSIKDGFCLGGYDSFPRRRYNVIINCVGIGSPRKLQENLYSIFQITEKYDNMALDYLKNLPEVRYVNFSSGAAYGSDFSSQVKDSSRTCISVNNIKPKDYYSISKINSEAKHRAQDKLSIVDIRIFSYFSRFVDLSAGYFLTDLLTSLKQRKIFITNSHDFIRDFISPQDLVDLIRLIINNKPFNGAIDSYSSKCIAKFKLLNYFVKAHSLEYVIDRDLNFNCPTGLKNIYCSKSRKAAKFGYRPKLSSLETVAIESKSLLDKLNE